MLDLSSNTLKKSCIAWTCVEVERERETISEVSSLLIDTSVQSCAQNAQKRKGEREREERAERGTKRKRKRGPGQSVDRAITEESKANAVTIEAVQPKARNKGVS